MPRIRHSITGLNVASRKRYTLGYRYLLPDGKKRAFDKLRIAFVAKIFIGTLQKGLEGGRNERGSWRVYRKTEISTKGACSEAERHDCEDFSWYGKKSLR